MRLRASSLQSLRGRVWIFWAAHVIEVVSRWPEEARKRFWHVVEASEALEEPPARLTDDPLAYLSVEL